MPADTLVSWRLTAERLQERIYQLEAIARLNGETIRSMQEAARAEVRHFLPITEALGDSAVNHPAGCPRRFGQDRAAVLRNAACAQRLSSLSTSSTSCRAGLTGRKLASTCGVTQYGSLLRMTELGPQRCSHRPLVFDDAQRF